MSGHYGPRGWVPGTPPAILGHHPHGGRVRLTVTELGQIGELVAWGEGLSGSAGRTREPLCAPLPRQNGEDDHLDTPREVQTTERATA